MLLIGLGIQTWVSAERWKNQKEQTRVAAESLQNNLGPSIPVNIKELRKLPKELALADLTMRFESTTNPRHKLALSYALADYGRAETEYVVSRIDDIADTDTGNFIDALKFDRDNATAELTNEATRCTDKTLWRRKAKLAIASLALGNSEIANDMCTYEDRPDPEQRTLFIDEFPRWELDIGELASTVRATESSALRSGICLGVGSIPSERVSEANQELWKTLASEWFVEKGDTSTHSAASWLLRQWKFDLPYIPKQNEIMSQRDWFVNSVGSTMLRIRPVPSDVNLANPIEKDRQQLKGLANGALEMENPKTLDEYWVADCEVTRGQFKQFIADEKFPATEKPINWPGIDVEIRPTAAHPAQRVSWYDAVMYCNWLSLKEGRSPCYRRSGTK